MSHQPQPRVVLVGGGHTHALVLAALAARPPLPAAVTLILDQPMAYYSGLLPGHVAGLVERTALTIDFAPLAAAAGVQVVIDPVIGLDRAARLVRCASGATVGYDLVSLNLGSAPISLPGALGVKPIGDFLQQLDRLPPPQDLAVVGGGAAGVEMALALHHRFTRLAPGVGTRTRLIAREGVLPTASASLRRLALRTLAEAGVSVLAPWAAVEWTGQTLRAEDGRTIAADCVITCTGGRPPGWLGDLGLPLTAAGRLMVGGDLASPADPAVFAVGDCAAPLNRPVPMAGVYAVRAAPVLLRSLTARLTGAAMPSWTPQPRLLTLLACGDGRALAGYGGLPALRGRWVWRWKLWLDQRFLRSLRFP